MRLRPYPKYKPSGVEWLGDVPEHWGALPLKRRHRIVNGGTPSSAEDSYWDGDINWLTPEDLGRNGGKRIGSSRRALSLEGLSNCSAQLVPRNSIVISTRAPIGHVAVIEKESCTNQGCRALVPEGARAYTGYIYYTLLASRPILQAAGKGTTFLELSAELLGLHAVPFPPSEAQIAIANFLDRETAKIDTLVAKKRTLIVRLKEKRTALISRTVTRGLQPDADRQAGLDPQPKLRPSGVKWLGDVPEHWEVKRLMHLTDQARQIMYGIVLPGPDVPDGVPIVKGGDVKPGRLSLANLCRTTTDIEAGYVRSRLASGDIVFSIRGTVGEAELVPDEITGANLTHDAARIAPSSGLHGPWLLYAMKTKAIIDPLLSLSLGAAVRGVNIKDLKRVVLLVPPLSEQLIIAEFLNRETGKLDVMASKVETAIERLQEYRTALITAAVTGKIDVHEAAA